MPAKPAPPRTTRPRPAAAPKLHDGDATQTRERILDATFRRLVSEGYAALSVREIAKDAGVTAMLINRYFGSKEQLFGEVLVEVMQSPTILAADNLRSSNLAESFASTLVEITRAGATPLEGFLIMMYSAASRSAAEIGRAQIQQHYQKVLASVLRGEQREERAALVFALVAGVQVMRQIIGLPALADADPRKLTRLLAPLFEQLIAPPEHPRSDTPAKPG
jgi:AcrR family transcriptional regulator